MKTKKCNFHLKLNVIFLLIFVLSRSMVIADNWVNEDGVIALLGTDSSLMLLHTSSIHMRKITVIVDKGRIHQSRMCKGHIVWKKKKLIFNFNLPNFYTFWFIYTFIQMFGQTFLKIFSHKLNFFLKAFLWTFFSFFHFIKMKDYYLLIYSGNVSPYIWQDH